MKNKWKIFVNLNIASAGCYFLILACTVLLFFSISRPSIQGIGQSLTITLGILVASAFFAPRSSRLRFHSIQAALLFLVVAAVMLVFVRNISYGYSPSPHDVEGFGGFINAAIASAFLWGGAIILVGLSFYLVAQAGRGHDIRLLAFGDIAAAAAGFSHKPTVDDFCGAQWGASFEEVKEAVNKKGYRVEDLKIKNCIAVKGAFDDRQARLQYYFADKFFAKGSALFSWEKGWTERLVSKHGLPGEEIQLTETLSRVTWRLSSGHGDKIIVSADVTLPHTEKKTSVSGSVVVVYLNERFASNQ